MKIKAGGEGLWESGTNVFEGGKVISQMHFLKVAGKLEVFFDKEVTFP